MTDPPANANTPKPKLRWYQFRLRTLLVITALLALASGTLGLKWREHWQRKAFERELSDKLGGQTGFDVDWTDVPWWSSCPRGVSFAESPEGGRPSVQIDDEMLGRLAYRLNALEWINLSDTAITDQGLQHLQEMTGLRGAALGWTRVSDTGMEYLANLRHLQALTLNNTHVSDVGMAHVARMAELEVLDLSATEVTDSGLAYIKNLTNLRSLMLHGTRISDSGLDHLKTLARLEHLGLCGTSVGDSGLQHLSALTRLEELHLQDTQVTDHGLRYLKGLANLRFLNLNRTRITEAGLENLDGFKELEELFLPTEPLPSYAAIHRLQQALPKAKTNLGGIHYYWQD